MYLSCQPHKKIEEVVMFVNHLEEVDPSSEQSTAEGLSTCIFMGGYHVI